MHLYNFFLALIISQTVYGVINTDLEQAVLYSDLNSTKEILNNLKTISPQELKAILDISKRTLKIRKKLLSQPLAYIKHAPTTDKSLFFSDMSILSGLTSMGLFIGIGLIKIGKNGRSDDYSFYMFLLSLAGMMVTTLFIGAKNGEDLHRCIPLANKYYNDANLIHSLLCKMPTA